MITIIGDGTSNHAGGTALGTPEDILKTICDNIAHPQATRAAASAKPFVGRSWNHPVPARRMQWTNIITRLHVMKPWVECDVDGNCEITVLTL